MHLCIDTISKFAGITLVDSDSANYIQLDPKNASEGIIDAIDSGLKKTKKELSDLQGVFVINGPGSFTGLRVGLTVANQFAHQLKIPIIALHQDEWWLSRTDESDVIYLQTMNKAEIYTVKDKKNSLEDAQQMAVFSPAKWLGQLSSDHLSWLPSDFVELQELSSVEDTWKIIVKEKSDINIERKTYEAVDAFYGKDPMITKAKKIISL